MAGGDTAPINLGIIGVALDPNSLPWKNRTALVQRLDLALEPPEHESEQSQAGKPDRLESRRVPHHDLFQWECPPKLRRAACFRQSRYWLGVVAFPAKLRCCLKTLDLTFRRLFEQSGYCSRAAEKHQPTAYATNQLRPCKYLRFLLGLSHLNLQLTIVVIHQLSTPLQLRDLGICRRHCNYIGRSLPRRSHLNTDFGCNQTQ